LNCICVAKFPIRTKRLLTDLDFIAFWDYFGRFSIKKLGLIS
jgi:hypothetical protein